MEKHRAEYENYLIDKNRSKSTIDSYLRDLTSFFKCVELVDINALTNKHVRDYVFIMEEKGKAGASINRALVALAGFAKFYRLDVEPLNYKVKMQKQGSLQQKLKISDLSKLLYYAEQEEDIRTVTLLKTIAFTGARISEALQIKVVDINKTKIRVKGKGSKYRDLLVPKALKKQFKEYINQRYSDSNFLFVGERGPINRHTAYHDIRKYGAMAKMKKDLAHPHAFRHLYALLLKEQGVHIPDIKQLMGHELDVTDHYMSAGEDELIKKIEGIEKRVPSYIPVSKRNRK